MEFKNDKTHFSHLNILYILPRFGISPVEQMYDCYRQLVQELEQRQINVRYVIKQTIFFREKTKKDYYKKVHLFNEIIKEIYNPTLPTTSFIAQVPENDKEIALEVYVLDNKSPEIRITHKSIDDIAYTEINYVYYKEIYAAGLTTKNPGNFHEQVKSVFTKMKKILDNENLSFSDIVRQWSYIERITKNNRSDPGEQNYQIFNELRSLFYGQCNFINGYPSATGIGTLTGGLTIEFIAAISSSNFLEIHPLKNPKQIDAHKYTHKVLVDKGSRAATSVTTPQFERGKLLLIKDHGRIYVSGTAAIVGETTSHLNDVEKQTLTTIENINNLLSFKNLVRYKINHNFDNITFSYLRVYVKYKVDLERVKDLCERSFKSKIFQYMVSDICRDELLIEIEGALDF